MAASPRNAMLSGGRRISARTFISTVPSSPNPIVEQLDLPIARGRLECDATMAVKGCDRVWAVGDCGLIPMPHGEPCPPTARHAIRQAKVLAANILADHSGGPPRSFAFTGLGKLGALPRSSVQNVERRLRPALKLRPDAAQQRKRFVARLAWNLVSPV